MVAAFLPAIYGGAKVGRGGQVISSRSALEVSESVPDIKPCCTDKQKQRAQLDYIQKLNQGVLAKEEVSASR